jgi:hypothetical protein
MKTVRLVFCGVFLAGVQLSLSGCGGSIMDNYANEGDANQILALTANKGTFTDPEPQGRYFFDACYRFKDRTKCPSAGKGGIGLWTRDKDTYKLEGDNGKKWQLTKQPDSSLRDENGVTWRFTGRAESRLSVEQNRATCIKLGNSKAY